MSQPPFPSLPQAMVQLLAAKILTITVGEAQEFLSGNPLRPAGPSAMPPSEINLLTTYSQSVTKQKPISTPKATHRPKPQVSPLPKPGSAAAEPAAPATNPLFVLERPKAGSRAEAHWLPTGMMRVLAGSTAAGIASSRLTEGAQHLRQHLLQTGVLQAQGNLLHFTSDYTFESPNQAAIILCGGSVNARVAWQHVRNGQPLGSYLAEHPASPAP